MIKKIHLTTLTTLFIGLLTGLSACTESQFSVNSTPQGTQDLLAVFGQDTRQDITGYTYPYTTIGKLTTYRPDGKKSACTATLVGQCVILTAAHCLRFDTNGNLSPMDFTPNGRYRAEAYVTKTTYGGKEPILTPNVLPEDWAISKLSSSLGNQYSWLAVEWGWDSTESYALNGRVTNVRVAGYSSDFKQGRALSMDMRAKVASFSKKPAFLRLEADFFTGASGGPILYSNSKGEETIVGIAVGSHDGWYPEGNTSHLGYGVPSDTFKDELLKMLKEPCP